MPIIPAPGRQRQEDYKLETCRVCCKARPCLKNKNKNKKRRRKNKINSRGFEKQRF
jgi:hypothetical protein